MSCVPFNVTIGGECAQLIPGSVELPTVTVTVTVTAANPNHNPNPNPYSNPNPNPNPNRPGATPSSAVQQTASKRLTST
jgi:hypothetical protein